ncbi:MAG TPA: molybdate ABC transporter permease subunit [Albitalea sp.]|uniref:molybdate ABC transporter permease subunit n=1 Tax=Piscinibacter sp. TaxID=1903157 RepID=UPI002ED59542
MDPVAARLSLSLAALTALALLPVALWLARWLATSASRARPVVEAALLLPLLLPPTVIGFYLLDTLGSASPLGGWLARHLGLRLVFSFEGLLFASVLINLPFMVQPLQRAFAAIPRSVREAAWVSGLSAWRTFWRIELPLAWPGVLAGAALTFAHTLGEFGVVLMVGGNIAGQTRTLSIAIYDRVQAFDNAAAAQMSLLLVGLSLAALALVFALNRRQPLQER